MGKVCHSVVRRAEGREQLHCGIANDEPLGLDGYGQWENEHPFVGECHAEGQQYGVYCTRGTHRSEHIEVGFHGDIHAVAHVDRAVGSQSLHRIRNELGQFLHQSGAYAAHHVVEQVLLRPPDVLHHAPEHPQRKHIEEDVCEVAVHEHIGHELVYAEVGSHEEVESEYVVEVNARHRQHLRGQKSHDVYDEQVLGDSWNVAEHTCFFVFMRGKVTIKRVHNKSFYII